MIEAQLIAEGAQTRLLWEERGMPVSQPFAGLPPQLLPYGGSVTPAGASQLHPRFMCNEAEKCAW